MVKNFIGLILLLNTFAAAYAQERILFFGSDIEIALDGSMIVTETIQVRAEGGRIKRGIYRDFPTIYRAKNGRQHEVGFKLLSVKRDDHVEPYHQEAVYNGLRIYFGAADVFLRPGEYTYEFKYKTTRQLGFFAEHDELYWNVTGNDWEFPIENVYAKVNLPKQITTTQMQVEAYTGVQGRKGREYQADLPAAGKAEVRTTQKLLPREGLTIVVTWPKGVVQAPTATQAREYFFADNRAIIIGFGGLALVCLYYVIAWVFVGRDPAKGVLMPNYQPPVGYSPGAARYIREMGYDHKAFVTAITSLAVKGALIISEDDEGFVLEATGRREVTLLPTEIALLKSLFTYEKERLRLENGNHRRVSSAISAHRKALIREYGKLYFRKNILFWLPGFLLSIVVVAAFFYEIGIQVELAATVVSAILTLVLWVSFSAVFHALINLWRSPGIKSFFMLLATFVMPAIMIFFIGEVLSFGFFATEHLALWPYALFAGLFLAANTGFYELMQAPTRHGRKLMDVLDGFREYLQVAEQEELNFKHPPKLTAKLFEAYLPYALALSVEQAWCERFAAEFARLQTTAEPYHPGWYRGNNWRNNDYRSFSAAIGSSLASAVKSSAVAPGSSSGSSGGGFSGGGGGGGGGGGW